MAAARVDAERFYAIGAITVGQRTDGLPPSPGAEHKFCALLVDSKNFLFEQGCGEADVFVDDLFFNATGSGTIVTEVFNKNLQKIADSTVTFSGRWARDATASCIPAYKTYYSAPVFVAADTAVSPQCDAHVTFSIASAVLGTPEGTTSGVTGLLVSESYRGQ